MHEPTLSSNIHLYFICHYILLPDITINEETKKDHWQGNLIKTIRACNLTLPHMKLKIGEKIDNRFGKDLGNFT